MVYGVSDSTLAYIWECIDRNGRLQPSEKSMLAKKEGVSEDKLMYVARAMKAIKLYGIDDAPNHLTSECTRRTKYVFSWLKAKANTSPITLGTDEKEEMKKQINIVIARELNNIAVLKKMLEELC